MGSWDQTCPNSGDDTPPGISAENRRPCPVCGEMIVATAVKCRFCGEMFGPWPNKTLGRRLKGVKSGRIEDLKAVAIYQRYINLCLFLQIVMFISFIVISLTLQPKSEQTMTKILAWLVLALVGILTAVSAICAFMLTLKVSNILIGILVVACALIPCLNWVVSFAVAGFATNILKNNGYSVGFLGADLSEF